MVKGEGMPIYNNNEPLQNLLFEEKKGNLLIKFDIIFPKFLQADKKIEIIRIIHNDN